jgi:hypothetical protein
MRLAAWTNATLSATAVVLTVADMLAWPELACAAYQNQRQPSLSEAVVAQSSA